MFVPFRRENRQRRRSILRKMVSMASVYFILVMGLSRFCHFSTAGDTSYRVGVERKDIFRLQPNQPTCPGSHTSAMSSGQLVANARVHPNVQKRGKVSAKQGMCELWVSGVLFSRGKSVSFFAPLSAPDGRKGIINNALKLIDWHPMKCRKAITRYGDAFPRMCVCARVLPLHKCIRRKGQASFPLADNPFTSEVLMPCAVDGQSRIRSEEKKNIREQSVTLRLLVGSCSVCCCLLTPLGSNRKVPVHKTETPYSSEATSKTRKLKWIGWFFLRQAERWGKWPS